MRELSAGQAMLERITNAMLDARAALWREFEQLHREMLRIVRDDEICRRLMSIPGVGPLVAARYSDWSPRNTNLGRGILAAALMA